MTDRMIVLLSVIVIVSTLIWFVMPSDHTTVAWVAIGMFATGAIIGFSIGTDRTI